ncbi:hypothetical protein FIBSPDRAFT_898802 [Athelia psychrophila]|uniref:Uncharacterized protein n=1 Tax=Athelia psychrophila TaxID=1759441 RepID=A0A166AJN7_9AGAM|nr:hypothetical protein FIBSPDRAFT_898802 [Fibularhizoctonia sp. CBS 109695]
MNHPNSIVASTVVNYIQASQNNYINKHYRYHCHLVEGVLLEAKSPKKELSSSSYKSTGATSEEKRGMEQRISVIAVLHQPSDMTSANLPTGVSVMNYIQGSQYNYVHNHYHYYHPCQLLQSCSATTNEVVSKAREDSDSNCTYIHEHHGCYHAASPKGPHKTRITKGGPAHPTRGGGCHIDSARASTSSSSVTAICQLSGSRQEDRQVLAPAKHDAGKKGNSQVSDDVPKVAHIKYEESSEGSTRHRRYTVLNNRLELQVKKRRESRDAYTAHVQRVFLLLS